MPNIDKPGMTKGVYDNIYQLGWLWLKKTDPNEWTPLMQETLLPLGKEFEPWWRKKKKHFVAGFGDEAIWRITSSKHAASFLESDAPVIAINEYAPAASIMREVRKILNEFGTKRERGRPEYFDHGALFQLCMRPDRSTRRTLTKMLEVYEYHQDGVRPLWRIGEKARLNLESTHLEPRRATTVIVSRYLKQADTLLANIVQEQFFKYK